MKEDGDLPGLAIHRHVKKIKSVGPKVAIQLTGKVAFSWIHLQTSGPSLIFVDYIRQQAITQNDPSFKFTGQAEGLPKGEKPAWKLSRQKEISVHKTDVLPSAPLVTDRKRSLMIPRDGVPFTKNHIHFETAGLFVKSHWRNATHS